MAGFHDASGRGGIIEGEKIQASTVRKKPGAGPRLHTHPNEQFNYVLKGTLRVKIGDVENLAPPGTLVYIPANAPHYTIATEDGEVEYFVVKDTSDRMHGDYAATDEK
jgi:quercetin dioxygenase-like cupin family protein